MRMPLEGRRRQNALNMESSRMRPRYNMISWHPTSNESKENEIRQRVMRKLTPQQIAANTTRGSTPGLINPLQGEAGGRVAHLVLRNGQGQVRGSRAQRPKKSKKINSSNRTVHSSEQAEEENLEAKLQEEDEVDQEPILELFPSVRRNYAANSVSSSRTSDWRSKSNPDISCVRSHLAKALATPRMRLTTRIRYGLHILELPPLETPAHLISTLCLANWVWRNTVGLESTDEPFTRLCCLMMRRLTRQTTTYARDVTG